MSELANVVKLINRSLWPRMFPRTLLDEYAFRTASGADRLYPEKPIHAILTTETRL